MSTFAGVLRNAIAKAIEEEETFIERQESNQNLAIKQAQDLGFRVVYKARISFDELYGIFDYQSDELLMTVSGDMFDPFPQDVYSKLGNVKGLSELLREADEKTLAYFRPDGVSERLYDELVDLVSDHLDEMKHLLELP